MADTTKPVKKSSPIKNAYLILYNAVSAALWLTVLSRVVIVNLNSTPQAVYPAVGEFCKWTQTLAGMEILHSLLGTFYLRSPATCFCIYGPCSYDLERVFYITVPGLLTVELSGRLES